MSEELRTSLSVFRSFLTPMPDGTIQADRIISLDCYNAWLTSQGFTQRDKTTASKFRRALSNHVTGVDGRQPFEQLEEAAILHVLRQRLPWPCFFPDIIGTPFRSFGYSEKLLMNPQAMLKNPRLKDLHNVGAAAAAVAAVTRPSRSAGNSPELVAPPPLALPSLSRFKEPVTVASATTRPSRSLGNSPELVSRTPPLPRYKKPVNAATKAAAATLPSRSLSPELVEANRLTPRHAMETICFDFAKYWYHLNDFLTSLNEFQQDAKPSALGIFRFLLRAQRYHLSRTIDQNRASVLEKECSIKHPERWVMVNDFFISGFAIAQNEQCTEQFGQGRIHFLDLVTSNEDLMKLFLEIYQAFEHVGVESSTNICFGIFPFQIFVQVDSTTSWLVVISGFRM
jgi:hypothetical protein